MTSKEARRDAVRYLSEGVEWGRGLPSENGRDGRYGRDGRGRPQGSPLQAAKTSEGTECTHSDASGNIRGAWAHPLVCLGERWRMASSPCEQKHGGTPCATQFSIFNFQFSIFNSSRGYRAPPLRCLGKHPRGLSAPARVPLCWSLRRERRAPARHEAMPDAERVFGVPGSLPRGAPQLLTIHY